MENASEIEQRHRTATKIITVGSLLVIVPILFLISVPDDGGLGLLLFAPIIFLSIIGGFLLAIHGLFRRFQSPDASKVPSWITYLALLAVLVIGVLFIDSKMGFFETAKFLRERKTTATPTQNVASQIPASTSQTISDNLIIKKGWGVSFAKDASYEVVRTFPRTNFEPSPNTLYLYEPNNEERITIDYISGGTAITTADSKFDYTTIRFDETSQRWTKETTENGNVTIVPAKESFYTPDNLPVFITSGRWLTYIIPLSHTTFIQLNITGSGVTLPLTDLVKTIRKLI
jgi:hypothetical protein